MGGPVVWCACSCQLASLQACRCKRGPQGSAGFGGMVTFSDRLQQLYTALVEADVAGGREGAWEDQ